MNTLYCIKCKQRTPHNFADEEIFNGIYCRACALRLGLLPKPVAEALTPPNAAPMNARPVKGRKAKTRLLPMDELRTRPCVVGDVPAFFHRWHEEYTIEGYYTLKALVEFSDGMVELVNPELIRFTDREGYHGNDAKV